jgi:hypothetical protein
MCHPADQIDLRRYAAVESVTGLARKMKTVQDFAHHSRAPKRTSWIATTIQPPALIRDDEGGRTEFF